MLNKQAIKEQRNVPQVLCCPASDSQMSPGLWNEKNGIWKAEQETCETVLRIFAKH